MNRLLAHQKAIDFTNLFRAIYLLVLYGDNQATRNYLPFIQELSSVFYSSFDFKVSDETPHEDLGLDLILFTELKADGNDATINYATAVKEILNFTERKFGLNQTKVESKRSGQAEINLIRLARSLYELVLHSKNESASAYEKLALEAKRIFDNSDNASPLHPELGLTILRFTQSKINGSGASRDESRTRETIEYLEREYGLAKLDEKRQNKL